MTDDEKLVAEARIFARLDGCEGGDLLNALADCMEMVHYTCALPSINVSRPLREAIEMEIEGHLLMMNSDNPEYYGLDEEEIKEAMKEIAEIHRG